jgi:hypothetical protein
MIRIPHRPLLAAVLILLSAGCSSRKDELTAALKADSIAFAPLVVRVPKSIELDPRTPIPGDWALLTQGVAERQLGINQYYAIDPYAYILSEGGLLRFRDRPRRVHTFTRITSTICMPNCGGSIDSIRTYRYAHRVEVHPDAMLGIEWQDDPVPWTPPTGLQQTAFTREAGWVVTLGRRELVEVKEIREAAEGYDVDFTWRWVLTPAGRHFDLDGPTMQALPPHHRQVQLDGISGLHGDSLYQATASLERVGGRWTSQGAGVWSSRTVGPVTTKG